MNVYIMERKKMCWSVWPFHLKFKRLEKNKYLIINLYYVSLAVSYVWTYNSLIFNENLSWSKHVNISWILMKSNGELQKGDMANKSYEEAIVSLQSLLRFGPSYRVYHYMNHEIFVLKKDFQQRTKPVKSSFLCL